ncbi:hypothetical protein GCM10023257_02150 [Streptomyces hyderabadensis]|uniref:Uncharacterized protein n=1 Tax=Streptomyces hyderabadensis TaxID=598549 RepID=A0ABP9HFN5_9ACTN
MTHGSCAVHEQLLRFNCGDGVGRKVAMLALARWIAGPARPAGTGRGRSGVSVPTARTAPVLSGTTLAETP